MPDTPPTLKWFQLDNTAAAAQQQVDPAQGLSPAEVQSRQAQYGSNRLAEKAKEPGWRAFLRQYQDLMQIILLVTGLVSLIILNDIQTFLLLFVLTLLNAFMSLSQEQKAEASLASLKSMMQLHTVRCSGVPVLPWIAPCSVSAALPPIPTGPAWSPPREPAPPTSSTTPPDALPSTSSMKIDRIQLDHGAGGRASHELVARAFLPALENPILAELNDAAA